MKCGERRRVSWGAAGACPWIMGTWRRSAVKKTEEKKKKP
jgi:hypothetical protein